MTTPRTRGWRNVAFEELVAHSAFGPRFSGSAYADDGNIATLRTTDLDADGRISHETMPLAHLNEDRFGNHLLAAGDLVITRSGTCGVAAIFEGFSLPVLPGAFLIRFRMNERAEPCFYRYYFNSPAGRSNILSVARGAVQQNLNITNVETLRVPLPPISEQRRIVSILSAYDDLIENNRRRMALLEDAARMLYREWFVRLRFPGHEHTRITNRVPEGWERVPTPETIEINPPTRLSDEAEHWSVQMADLPTDSMVIQQATKREGRSGSKFRNGDTLFARITPCLENGKTAFVDFLEDGEAGRGSTEFVVLRGKRVTPQYVYCLSRTHDFRGNAIKSMVGSSGRQRVQESCFEKFLVLIPPSTLLTLFTDSVRPQFRQIKTLHAQNQKLRAARDLLLPRLMTGEIAV